MIYATVSALAIGFLAGNSGLIAPQQTAAPSVHMMATVREHHSNPKCELLCIIQ